MITKEAILDCRDKIIEAASRHGAAEVRLFGSVARGDANEGSDVDLLVKFEAGRSLLDHGKLVDELEDLLGVKVDVVSEKGMGERLRAQTLKDAVAL